MMRINPVMVLLLASLIILTACAQETLSTEQQKFKEQCQANNHLWMKMPETKNGMVVGQACNGCMPEPANHLCNQKEYEEHIKR
ncbi:hypothetical protein HY485_05000 [Candidatus Woesearchaeota archaeon]|nr:hypothetical protein [Candidatus Woesearchaeota archaeon]